MASKQFVVVAVSLNANSFGLFGHVMVDREGDAWQAAASMYKKLKQGDVIDVPLLGKPNFSSAGFEIPEQLRRMPSHLIEKAWGAPVGAVKEGKKMKKSKEVPQPSIGELIAFEDGSLSQDDTVSLFQRLIDCGLAWKLQGCYGRTAKALIDQGLCTA
jgi:hypothetical protein